MDNTTSTKNGFLAKLIRQYFPSYYNVLLLIILCATVLLLNPLITSSLTWPKIGDEASYLAHAFTIGLDFDLDYTNEFIAESEINKETGIPKHSIGTGFVLSPFVYLGSIIDSIRADFDLHNRDNFLNTYYFHGVIIGKIFYFYLGFFVFSRILTLLKVKYNPLFLYSIYCSTGILHWAFMNTLKVHMFEIVNFLISIYAYLKVFESKNKINLISYVSIFISTVVIGVMIKTTNIIFCLSPFLYSALLIDKNKTNKIFHNSHIKLNVILFSISLVISLLFLYLLYGKPVPGFSDQYGANNTGGNFFSEGLLLVISNIIFNIGFVFRIMFSFEFGLLYTSPAIVASILYLVISLYKREVTIYEFSTAFIIFGTFFLICIYWQTPGSDYSWRYLTPIMAFTIVHFCIVYYRLKLNESIIVKTLVCTLIFISILMSISYNMLPDLGYSNDEYRDLWFKLPWNTNFHYVSRVIEHLFDGSLIQGILYQKAFASVLLALDYDYFSQSMITFFVEQRGYSSGLANVLVSEILNFTATRAPIYMTFSAVVALVVTIGMQKYRS